MKSSSPREEYTDNNLSMLKGLLYTKIAEEYFSNCARESSFGIKAFFNNCVTKTQSINTAVSLMLRGDNKEIFNIEIAKADVLAMDAIITPLLNFSPKKREMVERLINILDKGEDVQFEEPKTENNEQSATTA